MDLVVNETEYIVVDKITANVVWPSSKDSCTDPLRAALFVSTRPLDVRWRYLVLERA